MDYKFIDLKESNKFFEQYERENLEPGIYVVENDFDYTVIKNTGKYLTVEFFGTLEGCKKYLDGNSTIEEVLKWERARAKSQEKLICILFYILIFIVLLFLFYLLRI